MKESPHSRGEDAGQLVVGEIRAELARQRVSQSELAARLGVSRAYVTRRLSDHTPLSITDLANIADLLGVPVANFTAPVDERDA